jgi:UDPglucose 6-dehydrogenase
MELGAVVSVFDPVAGANARRAVPGLRCVASAVEAASGADVVMHLTEWPEFGRLDPRTLSRVVARRYVVDARNALDPERWRRAGWTYRGIGRPALAGGQRPVLDSSDGSRQ